MVNLRKAGERILKKFLGVLLPSAVSSTFWGGDGFSISVARRKTVTLLGSPGSAVSPPQWVPDVKLQKTVAILHSEQLKTSLS